MRKEGRGREAVVGVLARKVVLRGEAGEEEGPEAKSRLSFVEVPSCVELNVDNYSRGCPDNERFNVRFMPVITVGKSASAESPTSIRRA